MTRVVAHTDEWRARLQRTYRGLQNIVNELQEGTTIDALNNIFKMSMDAEKDRIQGDVVRHIGYRGLEYYEDRTLRKYDMVHIGVPIGDGKETALVFTSVMPIS